MDPPTERRRKRGINKITDLPPGESVEFNQFGQAQGKYRYLYGKYIGTTTRRNISILIRSWNRVPKERKNLLWLDIKAHFRLENDDVKKPTLVSCGTKWRAFKNKLRGEYMLKNISPSNTWTFLEPRIWDEFCRLEHYTPEKLKMREVARVRGQQQMNRPRLGSKGYLGFEKEWEMERNDPNKATELHLIPCRRASNYCLARVPRDQAGERVLTSDILKVSRDMTQASKQLSDGTIQSHAGVDAVTLVLGPEHGGRTRGIGGNVGYKKGIEGYVRKRRTCRQQDDGNEVKLLTIEDFKSSELWEEMKKVMLDELKEDLRKERSDDFAKNQYGLHNAGLSSNGTDGSTTSIIKFDSIKEATICCLYEPNSILAGEDVCCATATVYPIGDGYIHGKKILNGYMRVSALEVVELYKKMELPVPDEDIPNLEGAIEGFIQWPIRAIGPFMAKSGASQYQQTPSTTKSSIPMSAIDRGLSKNPTSRVHAKVVPPRHQHTPSNTTPTMFTGPKVLKNGEPASNKHTMKSTAQLTRIAAINQNKKKKDDLKEELISLKSHIYAHRSAAVKDGYKRWMSREDCAEPYSVHVEKEIFRQVDDYLFLLNATDIIELLTYEDLETGILTMSLYRLKRSSSLNKTGFLNPAMITSDAYTHDKFNTLDYLARALDGASLGYEFYLAPYLQGHHWVLFIICPKDRRGFILDSLKSSKDNKKENYELASHVESVIGYMKWELPDVNQQPGSTECGYYVMKWIHDFVLKYQYENFPNNIPWGDERALEEKEMEAIVSAWFTLWRD